MTGVLATAVAVAAVVAAAARARPWQALVLRLPVPWMQYMGLCGFCLGFWAGVLVGLLNGYFLTAVVLGAYVSLIAGTAGTAIKLLERAVDYLDLLISEKLK